MQKKEHETTESSELQTTMLLGSSTRSESPIEVFGGAYNKRAYIEQCYSNQPAVNWSFRSIISHCTKTYGAWSMIQKWEGKRNLLLFGPHDNRCSQSNNDWGKHCCIWCCWLRTPGNSGVPLICCPLIFPLAGKPTAKQLISGCQTTVKGTRLSRMKLIFDRMHLKRGLA